MSLGSVNPPSPGEKTKMAAPSAWCAVMFGWVSNAFWFSFSFYKGLSDHCPIVSGEAPTLMDLWNCWPGSHFSLLSTSQHSTANSQKVLSGNVKTISLLHASLFFHSFTSLTFTGCLHCVPALGDWTWGSVHVAYNLTGVSRAEQGPTLLKP